VTGHSQTKCKDLIADEIIEKMKDYREVCKTITYDNGREFTDHHRMAEALDADICFIHPYLSCLSWERGTNENTKLKVSEQSLQSAMDRLNHRPEKSLN